ncbi:MAG: hypothetical protein ACYSUQ_08660 [Planctomycetota bacterium]
MAECSGIVASRRYPGVFWVHNDSGHDPVLYAIEVSGRVVAEVPVEGATNIDWEDIAADDQGHLYVGDIGNNYGMFPVRSVYQIAEPDPHASPVQTARVVQRLKYSYPDLRFNAEALFVRSGQMFVITRGPAGRTRVYRLAGEPGKALPVVDVAPLLIAHVTGADVSTDGKRLAACTPAALHLVTLDAEGLPRTDVPPLVVRYPYGSVEACCFDGRDVVLTSEKRSVYRISADELTAETRFHRPRRPKKGAKPK